MPKNNSKTATAVKLGIELSDISIDSNSSSNCKRCTGAYECINSDAICKNLFCSKGCELFYVREALSGMTLEDCIRIQKRLEALLADATPEVRKK